MINTLLGKVVQILEEKQIPYMITGSLALNNYVRARMTMDIDFVIELRQEKIEEFIRSFTNGFHLNPETVRFETPRKGFFNIIDENSAFKIDFVIRKESEYRQVEFERKKRISIEGIDCWVVAIEDLIISKLIWIQQLESEKQKTDITELLKSANCDIIYVRHWIKKLNLNTYSLL